jgi:hypothetical protein
METELRNSLCQPYSSSIDPWAARHRSRKRPVQRATATPTPKIPRNDRVRQGNRCLQPVARVKLAPVTDAK